MSQQITGWPPTAATWQSPGYRSARRRAQVAMGFFVAVGLAGVGSLLTAIQGMSLTGASDASPDPAAVGSFLDATASWSGIWTLCAIGVAIAFLAWLSRTVEILPALGAGKTHDSPRWAIAWWFVPIAFLWKPYTVVRDVAARLGAVTLPLSAGLVGAWWLCWLGGAFATRIGASLLEQSATVDDARTALTLSALGFATFVAAAVLGLVVVREIQHRADERARALGFEAAVQALPSAETPTSTPSATPGA